MRSLHVAVASSFLLVASAFVGCDGGSSHTSDDQPPPTGPVGSSCSSDSACRPGLKCEAGACAFGQVTVQGGPCVANGECKEGLACDFVTRTCQPRGTAASGEACKGDVDCKDGLRCALNGFAAQCQPEGKADLGAACATSGDCVGGLACGGGVCAQTPPGVPPFGISMWKGVECGEDVANPVVYFRVPRGGAMDGDFFRLPFPNDARKKGGKPDYTGYPSPGAELLGFDPVQRYIDVLNQEDGWGAYSTVYFRFSTGTTLETLRDGTVALVDITATDPEPGTHGYAWFLDGNRSRYICKNWLGIRRPDGDPMLPGHTYAAYVTNKALTGDGAPFGRDADFAALMADGAPGDAALADAHAAYAPFRAWIKKNGKDPNSFIAATVFTVAQHTAPAQKAAAAVEALPPPTASGWVKCGAGASPCPDATGNRGCAGDAPEFDEYHGLISLPIFQAGTAPYVKPEDGGDLQPSKVRDEQVCASLTVPKGAAPASGFPVVIYAHGTGGSFRSHVNEGVAKHLATAAQPMAVLGIDQVQHGPRRGASTESPNNLFFNFTNPKAARGNPLQGGVDQVALARLLAKGELGVPGVSLDKARIAYWGHSQGATEGALGVPYSADVKGVVFSGQGASLIDALLGKKSPVNIAGALPFALQDPDPQKPGVLNREHYHPVLSLLQAFIDPADPLNHASAMSDRALGAVGPRHVFQVYGAGDTYSPPPTEETYAIAAALDLVASPAATGDAATLNGAPAKAAPLSGNREFTQGKFTLAMRRYAPASGKDGHFVAFDDPLAQADVARFLSDLAAGKVPAVGP